MRGKFITIEGIEGSGKSSVVPLLAKHMEELFGGEVIQTREPGGTTVAEAIRAIFLEEYDEKIHPETETLLVYASRVQHIQNLILPNLNAGRHVLSDRYFDATLAYQGWGREVSREHLLQVNEWVVGQAKPDLTFLLDVPVEVGMTRINTRSKDRIEQDSQGFFERVREGYLNLAKSEPERIVKIDATLAIEEVHHAVITTLKQKFNS